MGLGSRADAVRVALVQEESEDAEELMAVGSKPSNSQAPRCQDFRLFSRPWERR